MKGSEQLMKQLKEGIKELKIKCIGEIDSAKAYGYEYPEY